jgi:heat shock protein HtpX
MSASAGLAPTTFYREIDRNRRRSWILLIAVAVVLGALGGAVGYATGWGWFGVVMALAVATAMSVGSYFAGDALVMATSAATEIDRANPADEHRQLLNVVTEMSLAGGLPMPRVWIIDDTAPNAFATGRDPRHASVAVTTGLLQKLDREELQGVIAHEMSHIGNYDIRFTLLLGVLVGAIALLADFFLRFTFWGGGHRRGSDRDSSGGGAAAAVILVVALVLALLAPLIARIIQASVSRTRESLADVTGVELTRNPIGLSRALRKIADDQEVLEVANRATQHLYIVNPIKSFEERSKSLFDTHPPIGERIRALNAIAGHLEGPSAPAPAPRAVAPTPPG